MKATGVRPFSALEMLRSRAICVALTPQPATRGTRQGFGSVDRQVGGRASHPHNNFVIDPSRVCYARESDKNILVSTN